jgi:hypothetical protein
LLAVHKIRRKEESWMVKEEDKPMYCSQIAHGFLHVIGAKFPRASWRGMVVANEMTREKTRRRKCGDRLLLGELQLHVFQGWI